MAKGEIKVGIEFTAQPGNCQPCANCLDIIYGNRFVLEIEAATQKKETDVQLCESCYNALIEPK